MVWRRRRTLTEPNFLAKLVELLSKSPQCIQIGPDLTIINSIYKVDLEIISQLKQIQKILEIVLLDYSAKGSAYFVTDFVSKVNVNQISLKSWSHWTGVNLQVGQAAWKCNCLFFCVVWQIISFISYIATVKHADVIEAITCNHTSKTYNFLERRRRRSEDWSSLLYYQPENLHEPRESDSFCTRDLCNTVRICALMILNILLCSMFR